MTPDSAEAIVVLGCKLRWSEGALFGAIGARVQAAVALAFDLENRLGLRPRILVSGGRAWGGVLEADGMGQELVRLGMDPARIERERRSLSTRQNARFVAEMVGSGRVAVVTCDWHLTRALSLFRAQGLEACGVPAVSNVRGWTNRAWLWGRERVATALDKL